MKRIDEGMIIILKDGTIIGCNDREYRRIEQTIGAKDLHSLYRNKKTFITEINRSFDADYKLGRIRGILK